MNENSWICYVEFEKLRSVDGTQVLNKVHSSSLLNVETLNSSFRMIVKLLQAKHF